jgi:6-pyruvoyltetrahydropterin/6-carboxytetrahydropterin synthase
MPTVTVMRCLAFNAAHRLHNPALSEAENRALYGRDNNPHGHGHNYVLEVSVAGEVDDRTGYVLDLGALRRLVQEEVIDQMDHRHLNEDVDFLREINLTSEHVVVACWRALEPRIGPGRLARLRLHETENNHVEYTGH